MTRPMSEEREEALEAARRIVDRSYPFGRRQLANDADLVAHALLSTSSAERGMREALEWQPMETAPRDGTDVLLCFRRRRPAIAWGNHHDLNWVTADDDAPLPDPIGWMRLPKRSKALAALSSKGEG